MATKSKTPQAATPKPASAASVKANTDSARSSKAPAAPPKSESAATSKSTKAAAKPVAPKPDQQTVIGGKTTPTPTANAHQKADAAVTTLPEPAAEPMTASKDQKWSEIRAILEKLKEDTLNEIRKTVKKGAESIAVIEPGGDIYDQASSERDRELGLILGDREREKIHNIDEALLRIDEGDYGICEECDEEIPLGRLKAMPFARHCVKCKSDIEKLQAQTKRVEEERAYREIPLGAEEEEG